MIFDLLLNLMFALLDIILTFVPTIEIGFLDSLLDGVNWLINSFGYSVNVFSYILGNPLVIPGLLAIFMLLPVAEFALSLIWLVLHKIHIAGGGK